MNSETLSRTKSAHEIITNPNDFADQPTVRAAAWAAMKVAQGHSVDLDSMAYILLDTHRAPITAARIADTREQIETALDETHPQNPSRRIRIKQRVRNHAQANGYDVAQTGSTA